MNGIHYFQEGVGPVPDAPCSSAVAWKSFCSKCDVDLDRGARAPAAQDGGGLYVTKPYFLSDCKLLLQISASLSLLLIPPGFVNWKGPMIAAFDQDWLLSHPSQQPEHSDRQGGKVGNEQDSQAKYQ